MYISNSKKIRIDQFCIFFDFTFESTLHKKINALLKYAFCHDAFFCIYIYLSHLEIWGTTNSTIKH